MPMDVGKIFGRGVAFPPRVGADGHIAWSEGAANVRESIRIILLTEPSERLRRPGFGAGLGAFLFEPNTVTTRQLIADKITRSLARWEPRAAVQSVTVDADPDDPRAAVATITYRLVATGSVERVTLNITVAG
jgi:phage baseplate assembly protein W